MEFLVYFSSEPLPTFVQIDMGAYFKLMDLIRFQKTNPVQIF